MHIQMNFLILSHYHVDIIRSKQTPEATVHIICTPDLSVAGKSKDLLEEKLYCESCL